MKQSSPLVVGLVAVALGSCGTDTPPGKSSGSNGGTGTSGDTSSGGTGNVSGAAGTSALGGNSGTSSGGTGGASGGTAGAGAFGGTGTTGGSAGSSGSAGDSSVGGTAGAGGTSGVGGASGSAGTSGAAGSGGGPRITGDPMVYVGGYDPMVRAYRLNRTTGELLSMGGPTNLGTNPAYLAVDPSHTHLYAANETDGAQGGVTAASVGALGALRSLGKQGAENLGFVHVAVSPNGKFVVAASYNGGAVSVFPIDATGALGAAVDTEHFTGSVIQSHSSAFDRTGTHVFVPNKGLNNIAQFVFDPTSGALTPNSPATVAAPASSGPRHIAIHPNGMFAYVINENASSMTAYSIGSNGTLTSLDTQSTLPAGFTGTNTGAHVEVSPDGTLLFGSNRGHDSIVVFRLNPTTGAMTFLEHESTRGPTPRDFDVDPQGKYLIVANQAGNNLAVFSYDSSGLTPVGNVVTGLTSPAAVQFVYMQ